MTASRRAITLKMPGDIRICVPAVLDIMTSYCILEQDDWFEKEMAFVRRLLAPGMTVIDIGANYGVYSLAAARAVGPEGAVWAFEPASAVLPYLRASVAQNGFAQIRVVDAALADEEGAGHLHLAYDPGLNQLQAPGSGPGESVRVTALDRQQAALGWGEVDFIKLDAEGAERRILRGGHRFLGEQSPLVMFERIHNGAVDDGIAEDFRAMGWGIYRLPSADGYLVPLEPGQAIDPLELNLFACKQDRAVRLAERGLLALDRPAGVVIPRGTGLALLERQAFWPALNPRIAAEGHPHYLDALDAFAIGRDGSRSLEQRWEALHRAVELAKELLRQRVTPAICATLARIAFEAGERALAAQALHAIIRAFPNHDAPLAQPLWPAAPRYDAIDPGADLGTWFHAAAIEQFERLRSYSSHLAGRDTLPLLDWLQSTRFASHEMERRRILIRLAHRLEAKRTLFLQQGGQDCLNREAWLPNGGIDALLKS